jgi:hypothetical protein
VECRFGAPLHSICIYRRRAANWAWQLAGRIFPARTTLHPRRQSLDNLCMALRDCQCDADEPTPSPEISAAGGIHYLTASNAEGG